MEDKELSYEESMRLISTMINKVKKSYVTRGTASIVWGLLIIICSLTTWAEIQFSLEMKFDVWLLLIFALIPQIYFASKEKRQKKFTTYEESAASYVWTAFAIAIFITSFYNSRFGTSESSTLIMILYGIPTFITGGLVKFKPLIIGGIICWALSIASIFTPLKIDMLLMAACGLFAWFIPGIILWKRSKKNLAGHGI